MAYCGNQTRGDGKKKEAWKVVITTTGQGICCCDAVMAVMAVSWELKLNIGASRRANSSKHELSRPRLLNTAKTCMLSVAKASRLVGIIAVY